MPATRSIAAAALLISHPVSPCQIIDGIDAAVEVGETGTVAISYTLRADINQLLVPVTTVPRHVDGLWRHSCFEAFIGLQDSPAYYEFNFSPSSQWAAYRFSAYRQSAPFDHELLAPNISVERTADRLRLAVTIQIARLPRCQPGMTLRIGLAAVIEAADGILSYWALRHPAQKPDFHHPDSFALELALASQSA